MRSNGWNATLDEARPLLVKDASEMHVFVNNHGKGLSRQGIWKNLKQLVREAGIYKEVTPHTLRHKLCHTSARKWS